MTPFEQLGRVAGWVSAPAFAAAAALRRARPLHPAGELFDGVIDASTPPDDFVPLALALRGRALVRFSGALWKASDTHLPDVLGCAVRLTDGEQGANQDLLFATIKRPWTTALAPLTTRVDDFLANDYFGVSPFELEGVGRRFYLRLRPLKSPPARDRDRDGGGERNERLLVAVDSGRAELAIEASYRPRGGWRGVGVLRVEHLASLPDDTSLRFDPFSVGRGIKPRGLIHALRHGAYAASQGTRRLFE